MDLPVDHQLHCPYSVVQLTHPSYEEGTAEVEHLTCPDRRCCVWLDLRGWFGLDRPELEADEFRLAFTDIAHGGSGLYEKLVVLGARALETFSEVYIYEQFDPTGIPSDLLGGTQIPEEICRLVWTRKRVERLTSPNSLLAFAKSYLAAAQSLPTEISCVKYVKACIGYAIQLPVTEAQRLFEWMPSLVEHIYWAQRLHVEEHDEDNETLEDIQEYFGYPYSRLIPRIRESLAARPSTVTTDAPTGRDLIRFYAADYFRSLAEETKIPSDRRPAWVTDETDFFMQSIVFQLFAACWLNLGPYLAAQTESASLPNSHEYRRMFESLLAACYVLSPEEKSRTWMITLIHRLRQIQLSIHVRRLDILTGGPTAELEGLHNVDIHRWSSLSHILQHRQLQWTLAGLDDISVAMLGEPSGIPTSLFRKHVDAGSKLPTPMKAEKQEEPAFIDQLKNALLPCLRPRRPAYPITLIPDDDHRREGAPTLEMIPLGPPSQLRGRRPPEYMFKDDIDRDRGLSFQPQDRQHSLWERFGAAHEPQAILETPRMGSPRKDVAPARSPTPVFRRNKHTGGGSAPGCCHRVPRGRRGCPRNVWDGVPRDENGIELWRPPGALFMQPRHRHPTSPTRRAVSQEKVASPVGHREKEDDQETQFIPPPDHVADGGTAAQRTAQDVATTASENAEDDDEDPNEMKLKIRYIMPKAAAVQEKRPPMDILLYPTEKDAQNKTNAALRAVVELSPENNIDVTGQTVHGHHLKATLYPNPNCSTDQPVQLNFVEAGPTGSPRVYISSAKDVATRGTLKTAVIKRKPAKPTKLPTSRKRAADDDESSDRSAYTSTTTLSSTWSSTSSGSSGGSSSFSLSRSSTTTSDAASSSSSSTSSEDSSEGRCSSSSSSETSVSGSGTTTSSSIEASVASTDRTQSTRTTTSAATTTVASTPTSSTSSDSSVSATTYSSLSHMPHHAPYSPPNADILFVPPYRHLSPRVPLQISQEAMVPTPRTPRVITHKTTNRLPSDVTSSTSDNVVASARSFRYVTVRQLEMCANIFCPSKGMPC